MRIVVRNSPNQSQRLPGPVRLIVCHTPEGDNYAGMVAFLCNPNSDVSYHRLYNLPGTEATQLVPWDRKAWHALSLNSVSDGLAVMGRARHFDMSQPGVRALATGVAERLIARGLPPVWTTDVARGGFCRHADLQSNRSDPTPDIAEWRVFVALVQSEYERLRGPAAPRLPGPSPKPRNFWLWADWKRSKAPRGPRPVPLSWVVRNSSWVWRALEAWNKLHPPAR